MYPQAMRVADYGGDLFRITVQGKKEAEACHGIREELFKRGYDIPLVADIHFQPKVRGVRMRKGEACASNVGGATGQRSFFITCNTPRTPPSSSTHTHPSLLLQPTFIKQVALLTAEACEKIRVNPGNFADGAKKFTVINYENEVRCEG